MPNLKRPDGRIHYQEFGNGFPILLFAPGELRSRVTELPDRHGPPPTWSVD